MSIDFVIGHGQSLDWLQRGDATPMIRMLRAALRSVGSRAQGRRQGDGLNCEATKAKRPDTDVERTVGASICCRGDVNSTAPLWRAGG